MSTEPDVVEDHMTAIVVEDHEMVAEMLRGQLERAGFAVLGVASSSAAGLRLFDRSRPDLVLCDVRIEGGSSGIDLTRVLKTRRSQTCVVMVSAENDRRTVDEAFAAGASGYVSKRASGPELLQTIADALAGVPRVADRHTYRSLLTAVAAKPATVNLTRREQEILELMSQGVMTTKALAEALTISPHTVRSWVDHVLHKLGAHSRGEAVAAGFRLGLVQPPQG